MPEGHDPRDPPEGPDGPDQPRVPRQPGRDDREPVVGEVLGSRRDDEPLLGGAPRRLMVRLLVLACVIGVVAPGIVLLVVDGPLAWAVVRVGTGAGVVVAMVGWRILRVLHRAGTRTRPASSRRWSRTGGWNEP